MEKEKVVFFVDYANVNRAAKEKRYRLDYRDLLEYVSEGRFLVEAHCYVPINPRNEHRLDGVIEELWRSGYIVTTKMGTIAGGTYKCNFDVEITMDMLKAMYQVKPDIIVLASGDSDFVSLMLDVRKSGTRVEVAAFEETAGVDIRSKCSGFIDLAVYYESYLTALDGEQDEDGMTEQYKDIIQAQNSEQDGSVDHDQDLLQAHGSDVDDVKVAVDPVDKQSSVVAPDIMDELGL
jgi:uncharacterized LabA/DUF88 family protein